MNNITGSNNTTASFPYQQTNLIFGIEHEDEQIMRWLSPLESQHRHQGVRADRVDGVGEWLLGTNEFREWRSGDGGADKPVLFCFGNPGVGKTYLSSLVIDHLCDQARVEDVAIACLYYDFLSQQEQTITNTMGAILKQLLLKGGIPNFIREAYRKGKMEAGGRGPLLPDLVGMLKFTIASLRQTFICIDALDECLPKHLPVLLQSLRDIVRDSPNTRIFLTGRPHVRENIQRCFANAVMMPISPIMADIIRYLLVKLANDIDPNAMDDDLHRDIMKIIPERISDIFLLVSLVIEAILREFTIYRRRKKLNEMIQGNGVGDVYTATLNRVKAQQGEKSMLGMKVLMWVSHSERPLRADELCRAMGVEIGSDDFNLDDVPSLGTLVGCCLGLVTVEASSSTVRLVHFTLQEHLSENPTLFRSPHSLIAEVCLTYLNSQYIRDLSPTLRSTSLAVPLLGYASWHWGNHARKEMTDNVKALALKLLDGFDEHISAKIVLWRYEKDSHVEVLGFERMRGHTGFTGLHAAAFWGAGEIVAALLDSKKWDINATDCTGCTAIAWAARRRHEGVVKMLLESDGVNPDIADMTGRTPLLWAVSKRHEGVAKLLLEHRYFVPPTQTLISWFSPWKRSTAVYDARLALGIGIDLSFLLTVLICLSYYGTFGMYHSLIKHPSS